MLNHKQKSSIFFRYCGMAYIADQLFPPIKEDEGSVEFSNFNYWREPLPDLILTPPGSPSKELSKTNSFSTTTLNTIPEI